MQTSPLWTVPAGQPEGRQAALNDGPARLHANAAHRRRRAILITVAKAYVAYAWQDVGPWPPDKILVFAARADRVFVVTSQLKDRLDQIPTCEARWKEFETKYDQARRLRSPPVPPGEDAKLDPARYLDDGFEAYKRCYTSALPDRQSFAELTRRAQAIIGRLQEQ